MDLDIESIGRLVALLAESGIAEFSYEQDGASIRIRRELGGSSTSSQLTPGPRDRVAPPAPEAVPTRSDAPLEGSLPLVKSPIVGTFYRAPDPNSPPFVNVGDHVRVGQVLCIVEAMKLMNEIEAEQAGTIVKVHPENGQPVQYGDPLFTIKPD